MVRRFDIFLFALCISFYGLKNVLAEGSYVTSIKVDGKDLDGFASDNEGPYTVNVDSSKSSVILGYVYDRTVYDKEFGSEGETSLNYGTNELSFKIVNKTNKDINYKIVFSNDIEELENRNVEIDRKSVV